MNKVQLARLILNQLVEQKLGNTTKVNSLESQIQAEKTKRGIKNK